MKTDKNWCGWCCGHVANIERHNCEPLRRAKALELLQEEVGDWVSQHMYLSPPRIYEVVEDAWFDRNSRCELYKKETTGWQPIETAPKTGERILGCEADGEVLIVWWEEKYQEWWWLHQHREPHGWVHSCADPKHWMPLPEPPEAIKC